MKCPRCAIEGRSLNSEGLYGKIFYCDRCRRPFAELDPKNNKYLADLKKKPKPKR